MFIKGQSRLQGKKGDKYKAYTKIKQQIAKTKLPRLERLRSKMSGRRIQGVMMTVAFRDKTLKMLLSVAAARSKPKAFKGVKNALQFFIQTPALQTDLHEIHTCLLKIIIQCATDN